MKRKFVFLATALVFLSGAFIFLQSVGGFGPIDQRHARPFVVTFSRYTKNTQAKSVTIVQMVNHRGESLIRRLGQDGGDIEHFVQKFDSEHWRSWSDKAGYQKSTSVIRTEQIVGLTAYVFRQDVGSGQILERWYAPETGPVPLKEIVENTNGEALITEAIGLKFREVSDDELKPQDDIFVE